MAYTLSKSYQEPEKFVESSLREQAARETLRSNVLEEKAVDWIRQQVTVEIKTVTFSELQNPPAAEEDNDDDQSKQGNTDA